MNKYLFLDVDGVLNKHSDYEVTTEVHGLVLNKRCVENLIHIINKTDCKIILSSTWKGLPGGREFLERCQIPIFDITPDVHREDVRIEGNRPKRRGTEINSWLWDNNHIGYAIVDDDSDMLESQLPNFFQTDPEYGLTDTITYRIIYHLNPR